MDFHPNLNNFELNRIRRSFTMNSSLCDFTSSNQVSVYVLLPGHFLFVKNNVRLQQKFFRTKKCGLKIL